MQTRCWRLCVCVCVCVCERDFHIEREGDAFQMVEWWGGFHWNVKHSQGCLQREILPRLRSKHVSFFIRSLPLLFLSPPPSLLLDSDRRYHHLLQLFEPVTQVSSLFLTHWLDKFILLLFISKAVFFFNIGLTISIYVRMCELRNSRAADRINSSLSMGVSESVWIC